MIGSGTTRKGALATILLMALLAFPSLLAAQTLRVGIGEWKPYLWTESGTAKGLFIDFFREIEARSGIHFVFEEFPQNRMIANFRNGTIDAENFVDPSWRAEERAISTFSIPIMESLDVVLMKKGKEIQARSVRDFFGMRLGCILGYYYPDGFSEAFQAGSIKREDPRTLDASFRMLVKDRVDGVIADQIVANYTLRHMGLNPADFAVAFRFPSKSRFSLRLHRSKQSLLPRLDAAIEAMRNDGFVAALIDKHLRDWNAPSKESPDAPAP